MKRGYALLEQLETAPEVQQYIISEEDFQKCQAHGITESEPSALWECYTISCSPNVWEDLEIQPITEFPVIVLGTVDLYLE